MKSNREKAIDRLFVRFHGLYGVRFSSQYQTAELQEAAKREWADLLKDYTAIEIGTGIELAKQKFIEFPPNGLEFQALLRSQRPQVHTSNHDHQCKYAYLGDRCPAFNSGNGYCHWHSHGKDSISVLNFLLNNGVPKSPPPRSELLVAYMHRGDSIDVATQNAEALEQLYDRVPSSPPSSLTSYIEELVLIRQLLDDMKSPESIAKAKAYVKKFGVPNLRA